MGMVAVIILELEFWNFACGGIIVSDISWLHPSVRPNGGGHGHDSFCVILWGKAGKNHVHCHMNVCCVCFLSH